MTRTEQEKSCIPEFTSREEEAAFWETHVFTDYWDAFEVVDAKDVAVDKNLSTNG
jgi:hypothetical protein